MGKMKKGKIFFLFYYLVIIISILLFSVSCATQKSCDDFCKKKDFSGGKCDIQPLKNDICGENKIFLGVAKDCKPDTGLLGIEKGCCCTPKENQTNNAAINVT